ncbi:MAG: hypothetical protein FJ145_20115 [Deltaproteobacteria bacterium]|nr:hypothetical protein [Deltaproteobacteria bacterium]
MTLRDLYSSRPFLAGAVLLILGAANWGVGAHETNRFHGIIHKTARTGLEDSYRHFRELDHQKNQEVLRRINADREKYNAAKVKLNFYYVVAAGGKLFCLAGAALTLFSLVGLIRRDSAFKIEKLAAQRD